MFDLVLDRGMLNLLRTGDVAEYRRRLFRWLAPGGDYVLDHALKRRPRDWRPIGPTRRSEAEILALFEPDLELRAHERFAARVPLPVGLWLFFGVYWFRRPGEPPAPGGRSLSSPCGGSGRRSASRMMILPCGA